MKYNPFKDFSMIPNFRDGHILQWKLDKAFSEVGPYIFEIQISQTADFSELITTITVVDQLIAIDNSNTKQALTDDIRYRIKLTTGTGNIYFSPSLNFGGSRADQKRKYFLAAEISRKELLRLRKYTGEKAWLLQRKSFGQVSTDTVDEVSGVSIADNVGDYGVGIVGGYFAPLGIYFSRENTQQDRQLDPQGMGVIETHTFAVRTAGFPSIDVMDIIVGSNNMRYTVQQQEPIYFPGFNIPIVQKLALRAVPTTDTVYQIDIPSEHIVYGLPR